MEKEHFEYFKTSKARLVAGSLFVIVFLGMYFIPEFSDKWLLGSKPYGDFEWNNVISMGVRAAVYFIKRRDDFQLLHICSYKETVFHQMGEKYSLCLLAPWFSHSVIP